MQTSRRLLGHLDGKSVNSYQRDKTFSDKRNTELNHKF